MSLEELEEYEEDHIIELEDDEGNVEKFLHIATIDYKGNWYACFIKAEDEEEENEVAIFLVQGEGEETRLLPIEDDQLMDEVFAEFCNQYEASEEAEEAKKLDS